jgi:hypothetical protein
MSIRIKLIELEQELVKARSPVLKYFMEGLQAEYITSLFERNSLHPTDELVELYQWKNGLEFENIPTGLLRFGVMGVFLPLEVSVEIFKASEEASLETYFPIFSDDSFLIQLDRQSEGFGKIFVFSPALQILEPETCFDSLERMIETFIECFREGAYFYDSEGFFEEDYDKSVGIAKKFNPTATYWS